MSNHYKIVQQDEITCCKTIESSEQRIRRLLDEIEALQKVGTDLEIRAREKMLQFEMHLYQIVLYNRAVV